MALPIRVGGERGRGGGDDVGRRPGEFLRDHGRDLRWRWLGSFERVGQGRRAAGPGADEGGDLVGVAVDRVEGTARRAARRPGPR